MTTLHERPSMKLQMLTEHVERRAHRRVDLECQELGVDRWDGNRRAAKPFGQIVDMSAGGIRIRTEQGSVRPDQQIRLRLELPEYAGIAAFIDHSGLNLKPKREWIGWMTVTRVSKLNGKENEVAGRLVDMEDIDRGMLGLYLSTQPMAA
jgi:hypothetical protein